MCKIRLYKEYFVLISKINLSIMKNHPIFCFQFLYPLKTCFMVVLFIQISSTVQAQDKVMINSGFWHVASNWSPSGVPTSTQTVGIGSNYTCTIPTGYAAECANISLTTNADIVIQNTGSLTVTATLASSPALQIFSGSTITNEGNLSVLGAANTVLLFNGGSILTNQTTGQIFVNKATNSSNAFVSNGTVYNYGVINVGNTADAIQGSALTIGGNFTNFQNASVLIHKAGGSGISAGGNFVNKGMCQIAISGTVNTGIYVTNPMTNDTTGTITISGAVNNGFSEPNLFSSGHVTNIGNIIISTCTHGLAARFTNTHLGTMTINNCSQGISLSYSGGTSTNVGTIHIGNTGSISSHGISLSSNSDFTNTGIVNIDNANFGMRILDSGTQFVNSGMVKIGNVANIGTTGIDLGSSANFTNNLGGIMEINRCPNYAAMSVFNLATLTNSGIIKMGQLQNIGGGFICWGGSQINNTSSGLMEINRTSWVGFLLQNNSTILTNNGIITSGNLASSSTLIYCEIGGDFNNNSSGVVNADNVGSGIVADGIGSACTNSGLIKIGDITAIRDYGIHLFNSGAFTNLPDGVITLNKVNVNWWAKPIYNENGVFVNNGTIDIGNLGIDVTCHIGIQSLSAFTNNGIITFNNIDKIAIELGNSSMFQNNGEIIIGNINGSKEYGILINSNSTFTNGSTGDIEINDINFQWWSKAINNSSGIFNNSGGINIGNQSMCSYGIYLNGNFTNSAGGMVTINNTESVAFEVSNSATLLNNGGIIIGNIDGNIDYGILINSNSTFTNGSTGDVEINDINFHWYSKAIYNSSGTINNSGNINIGNQVLCSFGIYYDDDFNNLPGGNITINRITHSAIESHNASGLGSNNGNIVIGNLVGCGFYGMALHENSSFVNQNGGVIEINNGTINWYSGGIMVKSSLFSNLGIIRFGTTTNLNHGIQLGENTTDTGTFTNSGTLEFDRISDGNRAAIFCYVNTIFTNNATGIIKFGYSQPVQIAFRGGGTATNFGQLLCKNIAFSTVMTGQTLYNKATSTFKVFAGFTNYIDGTLMQATGSIFIVDGTLHNFGTVIGTVN
jgi:hypothetical protein